MLFLLLSLSASAQSGIDVVENIFGATNVNAVTGHGGLTAGVSAHGDLTVLSWPGPSMVDQLAYVSSNALNARELPRMGAPEGAGVFLGLLVRTDAGSTLHWLRDWSSAQDYGDDAGPNPHTYFTDAALGLDVRLVDAVAPDQDTLVRTVRVTRSAESPVLDLTLVTYANVSPLPPDNFVEELPLVDWTMDGRNDFAAVWTGDAVVHLHPTGERAFDDLFDLVVAPSADWGPMLPALNGDVDTVDLDAVADAWPDGSFVALRTEPAATEHQVGLDDTDWCAQADRLVDNIIALPDTFEGMDLPVDMSVLDQLRCTDERSVAEREGWSHRPADPLADLADGTLDGSDFAGGEVASALLTPLTWNGDVAEGALIVGVGGSMAGSLAALDVDPFDVAGQAEDALNSWISDKTLPGQGAVAAVARRSLINIRVGTDAATGAVVASPARQPTYNLDWPRDGAFFDVALDVSGATQLVAERRALYGDWQREEDVLPTPLIDAAPPVDPTTGDAETYPADAWEMNYTSEGHAGGNLRFEIDTTAFVVWATVAHVGWADDPEAYLADRWDTVARGTELLYRWWDPSMGLPAPAQEDDSAPYTQTLHGAISVFGALEMAARGARLLGKDDDAERWEARAIELRDGIDTHFRADGVYFQDASGRAPFQASARIPTGPTAWLIWPLSLYPAEHADIQTQLEHDLDVVSGTIMLEDAGGSYYLKTLNAAAAVGYDRDRVSALLDEVASHATPGTLQFGEVAVTVDGVADQRVATPHLWEGALFYLTAAALDDPSQVQRWQDVLPASRVVVSSGTPATGCGCGGGAPMGGLLVAMGLVGWRRRRTGAA